MQRKYINQKLREYIPFGTMYDKRKSTLDVLATKTRTRITIPVKDIPFLIEILQDFTKDLQNPDQPKQEGGLVVHFGRSIGKTKS